MTPAPVLAGYTADERGDDALALADLYARATGARLTVANVRPPGWPARGPGSVDAEWTAYLREHSAEVLDRAAGQLGERADTGYVSHPHRGSGRGLAEAARAAGAGLIVIGSAPGGRRGGVAVGSTADQLLHGAPVPVLLAPLGFADAPPPRLERLTVAYRRGREDPLPGAARLAAALDAPVRLVSLVPRPAGLPARFRRGAEDVVARALAAAEEDLADAAARLRDRLPAGLAITTEAAEGAGIGAALRSLVLLPGELLACQSSHDGPIRKVFLGESSGKIVRAASCPIVVLPRGSLPE
ncbi:Universal stress protein family protein [Actinomadura rubteroloni]|uniref:Universal stress protein family protein n=1 Tax=Actinomadura rubteroloni TaxID=1926885 RepID=A0A2P4UB79_9ACTN|nr:universal stress protein [Actinomadura rubteroloni]POM22307.1 Universal stress protein family protein [Actinomadura rubteroloni]